MCKARGVRKEFCSFKRARAKLGFAETAISPLRLVYSSVIYEFPSTAKRRRNLKRLHEAPFRFRFELRASRAPAPVVDFGFVSFRLAPGFAKQALLFCFCFLVLLVSDSEYNNFTGTQPIPCRWCIYFVLPLARCCCCCVSCVFVARPS
jgi:hypothetical protein